MRTHSNALTRSSNLLIVRLHHYVVHKNRQIGCWWWYSSGPVADSSFYSGCPDSEFDSILMNDFLRQFFGRKVPDKGKSQRRTMAILLLRVLSKEMMIFFSSSSPPSTTKSIFNGLICNVTGQLPKMIDRFIAIKIEDRSSERHWISIACLIHIRCA